jgi:hypothetical protein
MKINKPGKTFALTLAFVFVLSNSQAHAITLVTNKKQWQAQIFLANQIKGVGLADSFQEDNLNKSYTYDNALAAIASMAMGNFGLAKEILDTLCNEVQANNGIPKEYYWHSDSAGSGGGVSYAGNTAWVLQALNIYQRLKSSTEYFSVQQRYADFLISLQDPSDGGIRGSSNDQWKSVEHNIIAYVALRNFGRLNSLSTYTSKAQLVKGFLQSAAVWDGTRFNRGPGDTTRVTDVQSLGVLALGRNYASALAWAESALKLSRPFGSRTVTGFDFNDDLDTVWLEGTLQMALAFYKSGDITKGSYYYNEAIKAVQGDGSLVLATNQGTATDYWMLEVWRAAAPTCWLILYCLKFNPLVLY